jgi:hypothetical protein
MVIYLAGGNVLTKQGEVSEWLMVRLLKSGAISDSIDLANP